MVGTDSSIADELKAAVARAHDLDVTRRALSASVESLRLVAAAERANAAAFRRRLTDAERRAEEAALARDQLSAELGQKQCNSGASRTLDGNCIAEQLESSGNDGIAVKPSESVSSHLLLLQSKYKEQLEMEREQRLKLEEEVKSLSSSRQLLQSDLDKANDLVRARDDQLEKLQSDMSRVLADSEDTKAKCEQLEDKVLGLRDEGCAISQQRTELQSDLSSRTKELASANEALSALDVELTSCKERIADRDRLLDESRIEEQSAREEARRCRLKIAELEAERSARDSVSSHTIEDASREKTARIEADAAHDATTEKLVAEQARYQTLCDKHKAVTEDLQQQRTITEKIRVELAELRSAKAAADKEMASLARVAEADKASLASLEADLSSAEESVSHVFRLRERVSALEELLTIAEARADKAFQLAKASARVSENTEPSQPNSTYRRTSGELKMSFSLGALPRFGLSTKSAAVEACPGGQLGFRHPEQGTRPQVGGEPSSPVTSDNDVGDTTAKLILDLRDARAHAKNSSVLAEDMRAALARSQAEVHDSRSVIEEMRVRQDSLEESLKIARRDENETDLKVGCVEKRCRELEESLSSARNELMASTSFTRVLTSQVSDVELTCSTLEKTKVSMTNKIAALENVIASQEEDLRSTKSLLTFAHAEIEKLEKERTVLLSSKSLSVALRQEKSGKNDFVKGETADSSDSGTSLSLQRVAELEDSLSSSRAELAQKSLEVGRLIDLVRHHENNVTTTRELLGNTQKELESRKEVVRIHEDKLRQNESQIANLRSELSIKSDEIAHHSKYVEEELMPQLESARSESRAKACEIAESLAQLAEVRATSNKTRSLLEEEVAAACARLESTRVALESTQSRLTASEDRGVKLDERIVALIDDVRERDKRISEIEDDLRHRIAALHALSSRLEQLEADGASKDQALLESVRDVAQMRDCIGELEDRLTIAESRSSRRDNELVQSEADKERLEDRFFSLQAECEELREKESSSSALVSELAQTVRAKTECLEDQATLVSRREAEFDRASEELHSSLADRDHQIKVLQTENAATQRHLDDVSKDLRETQQSLQEAHECEAEKKAEISHLQKNVQDLTYSNQEKDNHLQTASAQLRARQEDIHARNERISSQSDLIAQQEGKIAGLRAEATATARLIEDLHESISSLHRDLQSREEAIHRLQEESDNLGAEIAFLKRQNSDLLGEIACLEKVKSDKESNILQLQSTIDEFQSKVQKLTKLCDSKSETIEETKHQLTMLESHLEGHDTLLKEYQVLQETSEKTSEELKGAKHQIETSAQQKVDHVNQLSDVWAKSEQLSQRISDLEAERNTLAGDLQCVRDRKQESDAAMQAALTESRTSETSLLREKADIMSQMKNLAASKEGEVKKGIQEIAELRSTCESRETRLREMEAILGGKTSTIARLQADLEQAERAQESLVRSVESLKADVVQRGVIIPSRDPSATVAASSVESNDDVESLKAKIRAKEKAIENLHSWCSFINSKLHAAEKSLEENQANLQRSSKAFELLSANRERSVREESAEKRDINEDSTFASQNMPQEYKLLLEEAQRKEKAVRTAMETASSWQEKYEQAQPIADLVQEAQHEVRVLKSKLEIAEREAAEKLDVMNLELETSKADRDAAERECAVAVGENAVIRSRLVELQGGAGSSYNMYGSRFNMSSRSSASCRVVITLDETGLPYNDDASKIGIVGSDSSLGSWSPDRRQQMQLTGAVDGRRVFRCDLQLSPHSRVEYKFIAELPTGDIVWEAGENRVLALDGASHALVEGQWRNPS